MKKMIPVEKLAVSGMAAALLCVLGPLSVPLPFTPVPVSLTNFAVCLIAVAVGRRIAVMSVAVYLFLGLFGLPVFSGFSGGAARLAGPTGGYLIGFLFLAWITGIAVSRFEGRWLLYLTGMVFGMAITYCFGTLWLCLQMHLTFWQGLLAGVFPYLLFDAAKITAGAWMGEAVRRRLGSAVKAPKQMK